MQSKIIFGPAGLGPINASADTLKEFHKLGLQACEIAFTYGVYIKNQKDAEMIGKVAKENNIKLSIHGHYYINLNSKEKAKIEASKKRILECCKVGNWLGAQNIVFHPGFYAGVEKETTYQNIKKAIIELQEEIKKNNWNVNLCPETTGKINVFGSVEEISKLVKETSCSFTIDFAHILAREKTVDYDKIIKAFPGKKWHCHFSGIEYTDKGERNHKRTDKKEWLQLFKNLPKDKEITIINESPYCLEDSVQGMKLNEKQ